MSEKKKEIEVINGDGSDLDISTVYEHIKLDKQKESDEKKKNIVIPKGTSENKKNKK